MLSFRMQRYNISSEYASISVKKTYFPALKTENKFLHTQTTHNTYKILHELFYY